MDMLNRRIVLARRPSGMVGPDDFRLEESAVPVPREGEAVVRVIYLTLDPYMRGMMSEGDSYAEPVAIGDVMVGGTVGEVIESRDPSLKPGDIVEVYGGWQSHVVAPARTMRKVDPALAPISTALGVLGMPGLTAYFGTLSVGQPKPGETFFVSAASGAVGATAGQIARIAGARVVGCAGSDEKVAYCLETCGFDACFNYRTCGDIGQAMAQACPDGIDVYFENVGGEIGWHAFWLLNDHGRMAVCGTISNYNAVAPDTIEDPMWRFITRRLRVEGFLVTDFNADAEAARRELAGWLAEGRIAWRQTTVDGLENAPVAFGRLFEGSNFGKLIVRVGEEPGGR